MHVQYSFVSPRPAALAREPLTLPPSLAVCAGLLAMAATTAIALIAG
jgi:hypothetical protein